MTAGPDANHHFTGWTGDYVGLDNPLTLTNVASAMTVTANFAIDQYTVNVSSAGNGTVEPEGEQTVDHGEILEVTATPDAGCQFIDWQVTEDIEIVSDGEDGQFRILGDGDITALFARDGSITVSGLSVDADVYLYAASGWYGKKELDGDGIISGLLPGDYLLCIIEQGKRTEYYKVVVEENTNTPVAVEMRDAIPILFEVRETVTDKYDDPITMGEFSTAVMEDVDRDGDDDLIIVTVAGMFYYYENDGGLDQSETYDLGLETGEFAQNIRLADLNADNELEIVVGLNTGEIYSIGITSKEETALYTANDVLSLTGFDITEANGDDYPDILLGYDDGSVYIAFSTGENTWDAEVTLLLSGGTTPINVGANAAPLALDNNGDSDPDLIVGNDTGGVQLFTHLGGEEFMPIGMVNSNGEGLEVDDNAALSRGYNAPHELPFLILTDEAGNVYKDQALLMGDFNRDGVVNLIDFGIFVECWRLTNVWRNEL